MAFIMNTHNLCFYGKDCLCVCLFVLRFNVLVKNFSCFYEGTYGSRLFPFIEQYSKKFCLFCLKLENNLPMTKVYFAIII